MIGTQPAERTLEADLRNASCGPSRGEAAARRSCRTSPNSGPARSRSDGPATWRSSPPPDGACGPMRPNGHKFIIGLQPAEERRERTCGTRAAGLRCREAAARRSLRDRFCLQQARNRRFSPSYFAANSTAQQSAARSRPRAEGCILALLESRPVRSAAGCCGFVEAANSEFNIQNYEIGAQPAECAQVRQRTAGLRRREAAARRS